MKNELFVKEIRAAYELRIDKINAEWHDKHEAEQKQKNELKIMVMSERGTKEKLE